MLDLQELKFNVDTSSLDRAIQKLDKVADAMERAAKAEEGFGSSNRDSTEVVDKLVTATETLSKATQNLGTNLRKPKEEGSSLEKLLQKLNNQYGDLATGFTKGEASILQQARNFGAAEDALKPFIDILSKIKELTKDPFDASVGALRNITGEFEKVSQRANLMAQGIALSTKQLSEFSKIGAEVAGIVTKMGFDPKSGKGLEIYNEMLKETQADYLMVAQSINTAIAAEKRQNDILKAQQKVLEENATMMDSAVSQFRRNEEVKAAAAEKAANKIVAANLSVEQSIKRINDITEMVKGGMSEREATKRVDMGMQGVDAGTIDKLIAAENNLISTRQKGVGVNRELLNSQKWLANEEEKMLSLLASMNDATENSTRLDEKHARSVANYAKNLRQAGITGKEAADKLELYKQQQLKITEIEERRQIKNLQRGLQPQIGDVVVSLAAGQNPLTVMLQQGDQIRGLIAQTGVQGEALQKAFRDAMSGTVDSIKMTAGAMVNLLGGAISSTANGILNLVTGPIKAFRQGMKDMKEAGEDTSVSFGAGLLRAFEAFGAAVASISTLIIGSLVVALGALAVASYKASNEQDKLQKSLVLTGASLGVVGPSAIQFVKSFENMGVNASRATEILTAFGDASIGTKEDLQKIIPVAKDLQDYFGMTAKEIADRYKDFYKDPVKALAELGEKTGLVKVATIDYINGLVEAGEKTKAIRAAIEAAVEVDKKAVEEMKQNYSTLGLAIAEAKKWFNDFWSDVKGLQFKDDSITQYEKQIKALQKELKRVDTGPENATANAIQAQIIAIEKLIKAERDKQQAAVTARAEQSRAAAVADEVAAATKRLNDEYDKLTMKTMTKDQFIEQFIKKRKEELDQKAAGAVYDEKALETLKKVAELEFMKTKTYKDGESERKKLANAAEKDRQHFINQTNEANGVVEQLTKAERDLNSMRESANWKGYNDSQKEAILLEYERAKIAQKNKEIRDNELKTLKETIKYESDRRDMLNSIQQDQMKQRGEVALENDDLNFRLSILGKTTEEIRTMTDEYNRQKEIAKANLELDLERKKIWDKFDKLATDNVQAFDTDAYNKAIKDAEDIRNSRVDNANKKLAVSAAEYYQKEFDRISGGITDSIVTALFEGGKAGSKKLRDVIIAELKKPVTMVVKAIVDTVLGGSSYSGKGGVNSLLSTGNSLVQAGSSIGGLIGTGIGAIGAGTGAFGSGLSMAMSGNAGLALEGGISMMGSATGASSMAAGIGQTLGAVAPYLAAAYAIYSIAKSLDKSGTMHIGGSSSFSSTGGLQTGMGVSGVGQNTGNNYSSDYEKLTTDLTKSVVSILDTTAVTFGKTAGYQAAAGFADDSSKDGAWGSLVISKLGQQLVNWQNTDDKWPGRTFADGTQGANDYISAVAKDVKTALESIGLPDWAKSMLDQLGNAPTLDQLATVVAQINAVQGALVELGKVMPGFANLSAEAVNTLTGALGGIDGLMKTTSSYYQNFFSDQEKMDAATANLKKQFEALNIEFPADRIKYREAVDAALKTGNTELAAKLLQLSDAFASISQPIDAANDSVDSLTETMKQLQADTKDLEAQLLQAQGKTDLANAAFRAIATEGMSEAEKAVYDYNESLRKVIEEEKKRASERTKLEEDLAQVQGTTADLRARELAALDPANRALQEYVWQLQDQKVEQDKINASLANLGNEGKNLQIQLMELQGNADGAKAATRALAIDGMSALEIAAWDANQSIRDQIAAIQKQQAVDQQRYDLETQLLQVQGNTAELRARELALIDEANRPLQEKIWQLQDEKTAQEEAAKAAEQAAQEVARAAEEQTRAAEQLKAAWQSVTDSIFEEVRRIRGLASNDAMNYAKAQYEFNAATEKARSGDQAAAKSLPQLSQTLLELANNQASSLVELRRIQMLTAASLEQTGRGLASTYGLAVPAYANGGSYQGGLALVGENGPELINFSQSGQVYNANATASMLANTQLVDLVRALNDNITELRYEVRADVTHNAKTAKILDRAMKDGETLSVSFETPQQVTVV